VTGEIHRDCLTARRREVVESQLAGLALPPDPEGDAPHIGPNRTTRR